MNHRDLNVNCNFVFHVLYCFFFFLLNFGYLSESNLSNLSLDKILADVERVTYFLILIFDFLFIDFNSILPKQNDKYCSVKCICTATFNKKQIGFYYHSEIYRCD